MIDERARREIVALKERLTILESRLRRIINSI